MFVVLEVTGELLIRESGGMTVSVEDAGSVYSSWGFGLLVALV